MTRRRMRLLTLAAVLSVTGVASIVATVGVASADTTLCDQYASTTVGGRYVVQNNRWGTSATQCISVGSSGFQITRQDGVSNSGAPVSYPSMFYGCHYTNCSPGTVLPKKLNTMRAVNSSISFNYVSNAKYDATYDIWLDPTAKKDGVNQTEIMIWFNRTGGVQPVGSAKTTASIGGKSWQVWIGNNGGNNVVSYVAPSSMSSWSFNILDFIKDTRNRGYCTDSWYLTSVQAGFEPWQGGVGLAVNSFSTSVS